MSERMDVARDGWGDDVPDWVAALVEACDVSSQARVGKRIGYAGTVISQVIRNKYPGAMSRVEERVRAIFLGGEIACPALGLIGSADCLGWRDKSRHLLSSSPLEVRMFRACRECPRNAVCEEEEAA